MLDKLKALFIVQEEEKDNTAKKAEISDNKFEEIKNNSTNKISNESTSFNTKIMTQLLQVLHDNNQTGFDYIEYKNAVKSLKSMNLDEKTRFQSAFTTAKTLGVTKIKLLNSIGFYQKILLKEEEKFTNSLKNNTTDLSLSQKKEITNSILIKKKQIKQLTSEIKELEKKIYGVNKNGHSSSDFEITFNRLIQEMRADIKKINKYL